MYRPHVLIVDDHPENLRQLVTMLGGQYSVQVADSGNAALAAIDERQPDLILLDIGLPDIDGFEVCQRVRAIPAMIDVPVIFISGRTGLADKVESFSAGGFDYVEKPFHADEVLARVDTHVSLHRRRQSDRERAEALEQLVRERESLLEERKRLTAMIVHDIGSPLMVATHFLEAIDPSGDRMFSIAGWTDAVHSLLSIREMTKQALVLAQFESARMPLNIERHRLTKVVDGGLAMARGQVVRVDCDEGAEVWCDRSLIERVIANLVNNADDHGQPPVEVRGSVTGDEVEVTVTDSGPGVAPGGEDLVFDEFRSSRGLGRGLGLAFCRHAIEAHHGSIAASGSEFRFSLPRP